MLLGWELSASLTGPVILIKTAVDKKQILADITA